MKATELMIGDKVMVKVLSQIPDTYVLHTWTANDYSRVLQVKPIPLTHEILEKNDWGYVCETYFKSSIRYFPEIRITAFIKNVGKLHLEIINNYLQIWFNYFHNYESMDADVIVPIKYIHDMQHALRLCGLNELADNFKV